MVAGLAERQVAGHAAQQLGATPSRLRRVEKADQMGGNMHKILWAMAAAFILVACGPSFDEDGLEAVEDWANDAITQGETAAMDIAAVATGSDAAWSGLDEHRERLDGIADRADDLPDSDEVASWTFNRTVGGEQFTVNGRELAEAVDDLEDAVRALADEAEMLHDKEGEVEDSDLPWIDEALSAYAQAADGYRAVMFPQS